MTLLVAASAIPHPPYMLVPVMTAFGGLGSALHAWVKEVRPNWAEAWIRGNVLGGLFGLVVVTLVYAAGVD
jgi:hypothetical protein